MLGTHAPGVPRVVHARDTQRRRLSSDREWSPCAVLEFINASGEHRVLTSPGIYASRLRLNYQLCPTYMTDGSPGVTCV